MAKICCGGFNLGEGLELDGKTLKATGGAGGGLDCYIVKFNVNGIFDDEGDKYYTVDCDKNTEDILAAHNAGKVVVGQLSCDYDNQKYQLNFMPLDGLSDFDGNQFCFASHINTTLAIPFIIGNPIDEESFRWIYYISDLAGNIISPAQ